MLMIFARHGETVFGSEERLEGLSKSPLTENGRKQAERLGFYCQEKEIKTIISSPLLRTMETASVVGEILKIKPKIDERLREICFGEWEGRRKDILKESFLWGERKKDLFHFSHPGFFKGFPGESYSDAYNRFVSFIEEFKPRENSLIVTHLGIVRSALLFFKKASLFEFGEFTPPNNQIIIVNFPPPFRITTPLF